MHMDLLKDYKMLTQNLKNEQTGDASGKSPQDVDNEDIERGLRDALVKVLGTNVFVAPRAAVSSAGQTERGQSDKARHDDHEDDDDDRLMQDCKCDCYAWCVSMCVCVRVSCMYV